MNPKKFSIRLISLIFLIFLLNYLATEFHWYSSIWYFDMIMHVLGGIWLGLASIYLFPLKEDSFKFIFKIFLIILLVGVGWEIFEILVDKVITQNSFNTLDTLSDIFFDLSGGCFAILYFLKRTMPIKGNTV